MSKKWARVKSTGGSISGVGTLEFSKTKVRITFEEDEKGVYTLPLSELEELTFEPKEGKDYYIALNGKGDKVYNIRPAAGIFTVRCVDFIRPDKDQQEEPAPISRVFKREGQQDNVYHQFGLKLEIVDDKRYPGVTMTSYLPYDWFIEADDGSVGLRTPKKASTNFDKLESFLELSGAFDTVIDWDDENILPALLTVIKKAKRKFDVELKDGWVNHFLPNRDIDEDDEPDETKIGREKLDLAKDDDEEDDEPVKAVRKPVVKDDFDDDETVEDED